MVEPTSAGLAARPTTPKPVRYSRQQKPEQSPTLKNPKVAASKATDWRTRLCRRFLQGAKKQDRRGCKGSQGALIRDPHTGMYLCTLLKRKG